MATVHGTPLPLNFMCVWGGGGGGGGGGVVSRVCPGGPYLLQWTVMGHNLWGDWMLLP